jgi:hypothetical protein
MSASAPAVNSVCVIWNSLQVALIAGCGLLASSGGADRCQR